MGEGARAGMRRSTLAACVAVTLTLVWLQSAVHLAVVLGSKRIETIVDLDRSNGLPDLASTAALLLALAGALQIAWRGPRDAGQAPWLLSAGLGFLVLADLVHDGPHPASTAGWVVIVVTLVVGLLLVIVARDLPLRARVTVVLALFLLAASFGASGLDRLDARRFERERGDPIVEYRIVAKEGLELLGWSLVALALWDGALGRRDRRPSTAPASRARAASRRRAA